jgi:hypothetical protein
LRDFRRPRRHPPDFRKQFLSSNSGMIPAPSSLTLERCLFCANSCTFFVEAQNGCCVTFRHCMFGFQVLSRTGDVNVETINCRVRSPALGRSSGRQ